MFPTIFCSSKEERTALLKWVMYLGYTLSPYPELDKMEGFSYTSYPHVTCSGYGFPKVTVQPSKDCYLRPLEEGIAKIITLYNTRLQGEV